MLTSTMSHVDQSKHPSLRHMNNGNQGKSRNDRFTWRIMSSTTVLGYTLHVLFFFPLVGFQRDCTVPAHFNRRYLLYRYTLVNCIQRRLGWGAGYITISQYFWEIESNTTSTTDLFDIEACYSDYPWESICQYIKEQHCRTASTVKAGNVKPLSTHLSFPYLLSVQVIIAQGLRKQHLINKHI
jgi:hypothetical protein